jgi:hypothetical protein
MAELPNAQLIICTFSHLHTCTFAEGAICTFSHLHTCTFSNYLLRIMHPFLKLRCRFLADDDTMI